MNPKHKQIIERREKKNEYEKFLDVYYVTAAVCDVGFRR
jgi:hypothetical protein